MTAGVVIPAGPRPVDLVPDLPERPEGAAVTVLTEVGARRLTDRIRGTLSVAWELLVLAYEGEAWRALGYDTWDAYCAEEFAEARRVRLPAPERRELVATFRRRGMSTRAIADGLGVSQQTVNNDRAALAADGVEVEPEAVRGTDSRRRASTVDRPPAPAEPLGADPGPPLSKRDRVAALVAAQGSRGMTCAEVELETGWHHGVASSPVSALARQGRIVHAGRYRLGFTVYVTPVD